MTRAKSKYVYLFLWMKLQVQFTYMTIIKCPKFSNFLKGMPTVMIYYITVYYGYTELVVPTLLILLVFKKMRIFLPLSAPKWPTHRAFKVIKGTRCKSPINLIFFSTISSEERERIFMKFLKRNLSILCSGVAEWPAMLFIFNSAERANLASSSRRENKMEDLFTT